ncbi:MAG TPA: glycosyltransferase family 39 protein [Candidatus Obscuribacterales bacterium]
MIQLIASLILPAAYGYLFLRCLWVNRPSGPYHRLAMAFMGLGLGFGLSSLAFFLTLPVPGSAASVVAELALLLGGTVLCVAQDRRIRHQPRPPEIPGNDLPLLLRLVLVWTFALTLLGAGAYFVLSSLESPHAVWDAWAAWNNHARYLYYGGSDHYKNVFYPTVAVPDYPLLIPSLIARCWKFVGSTTTSIPILVAFLFTFASAGLLVAAVTIFRGRNQGLMAGLILLSTYWFVQLGTYQMADIPLAFYILAAVVALALHEKYHDAHGLLIVTGLFVGLATWTKVEGMLFAAALFVSVMLVACRNQGVAAAAKSLAVLAGGFLPVFTVVLYTRMLLAPPGLVVTAQSVSTNLTDARRAVATLQEYPAALLRYFKRPLLLIAAFALLSGVHPNCELRGTKLTIILTIAFVLIGSYLVFLALPESRYPLQFVVWRVFMELWPTAVFLVALYARTPEDCLKPKQPPRT